MQHCTYSTHCMYSVALMYEHPVHLPERNKYFYWSFILFFSSVTVHGKTVQRYALLYMYVSIPLNFHLRASTKYTLYFVFVADPRPKIEIPTTMTWTQLSLYHCIINV